MKKIKVVLLAFTILFVTSCSNETTKNNVGNKPSDNNEVNTSNNSPINIEDLSITTVKAEGLDIDLYFAYTTGEEELIAQGFNQVITTSGEYTQIAIFSTSDLFDFEIAYIKEEFDDGVYEYEEDDSRENLKEELGTIKAGDVVLSKHDTAETVPYIAYSFETANDRDYSFVFYSDSIGDSTVPIYEFIDL